MNRIMTYVRYVAMLALLLVLVVQWGGDGVSGWAQLQGIEQLASTDYIGGWIPQFVG